MEGKTDVHGSTAVPPHLVAVLRHSLASSTSGGMTIVDDHRDAFQAQVGAGVNRALCDFRALEDELERGNDDAMKVLDASRTSRQAFELILQARLRALCAETEQAQVLLQRQTGGKLPVPGTIAKPVHGSDASAILKNRPLYTNVLKNRLARERENNALLLKDLRQLEESCKDLQDNIPRLESMVVERRDMLKTVRGKKQEMADNFAKLRQEIAKRNGLRKSQLQEAQAALQTSESLHEVRTKIDSNDDGSADFLEKARQEFENELERLKAYNARTMQETRVQLLDGVDKFAKRLDDHLSKTWHNQVEKLKNAVELDQAEQDKLEQEEHELRKHVDARRVLKQKLEALKQKQESYEKTVRKDKARLQSLKAKLANLWKQLDGIAHGETVDRRIEGFLFDVMSMIDVPDKGLLAVHKTYHAHLVDLLEERNEEFWH